MKDELGFSRFVIADKDKVFSMLGYRTGVIPLIGHNLPCIFDDSLLDFDYIYGGSGDEYHTLKIIPKDVIRLNNVIGHIGVLE